jgi:hypothetical protein
MAAASAALEASLPILPREPVKTVDAPAKAAPEKAAAAPRPVAPRPEPKPRAEVPAPQSVAPAPVLAPEPAVAAGPAPACGPREGIRYHVCMERECGRGEFAGHPACLRWKQDAKRE